MIKPGKACSQLMEANYTGETEIKVVGNIFRLTFVFNAINRQQAPFFWRHCRGISDQDLVFYCLFVIFSFLLVFLFASTKL
jgi:hypothetical protein